MTLRRFALTLLLALASAFPAAAASGGSTLPFNEALTRIQENLTGPTANTVIVVLIIGALITIGVSRENGWMKGIGGAVILCACIAKAAAMPEILGLGTATATPYAYLVPQVLLHLLVIGPVLAAVLQPLCEPRSPSHKV
jgi:type IV secretory pathway VirB2 component (pilin)